MKAEVKHAAREHGVGDQVILLGRLDHPALTRAEWAQLAILPSHAESFSCDRGGACLWASGCILRGRSSTSCRKKCLGWLVPPRRTDRLAEAIVEAMQDPQRHFAWVWLVANG